MTPIEKTSIIEAAFADIEKIWFENRVRLVAIQVYQNGESVAAMKAGLETTVVKKVAKK